MDPDKKGSPSKGPLIATQGRQAAAGPESLFVRVQDQAGSGKNSYDFIAFGKGFITFAMIPYGNS